MSKAEYDKLPFGIDFARPNGVIDFEKISGHSPRVCFAGIRAGVSWGYKDPNFDTNWTGMWYQGIARTAYHVLYPGQDPVRQMQSFLSWVEGSSHSDDLGELPLVMDVELDHGYPAGRIEYAVKTAAEYLTKETGTRPIIYSRASWLNHYLFGGKDAPDWLKEYDLWLAHYALFNGLRYEPPTPPKGIPMERVLIHQFGTGPSIGMQSKKTDYNVWLKGFDHFFEYVGEPVEDEEPEDEEPVEDELNPELKSALEAIQGHALTIDYLAKKIISSNNDEPAE